MSATTTTGRSPSSVAVLALVLEESDSLTEIAWQLCGLEAGLSEKNGSAHLGGEEQEVGPEDLREALDGSHIEEAAGRVAEAAATALLMAATTSERERDGGERR